MKKVAVLFCTCILFVGCSSNPKVDIQAEAAAIRNMEEQWNVALQKSDPETIINFYANEAVLINSARPTVIGLDGIRKVTLANFADTTLLYNTYSATIDAIEVSASGDIAYTRGHDEITKKTPAGLVKTEGRWVDIWKKSDGQWKVVVLVSGDVPLEGQK